VRQVAAYAARRRRRVPAITRPAIRRRVRRAREAFKCGDLFEVVPGQTFLRAVHGPASELFRRLRERNPAPYCFSSPGRRRVTFSDVRRAIAECRPGIGVMTLARGRSDVGCSTSG